MESEEDPFIELILWLIIIKTMETCLKENPNYDWSLLNNETVKEWFFWYTDGFNEGIPLFLFINTSIKGGKSNTNPLLLSPTFTNKVGIVFFQSLPFGLADLLLGVSIASRVGLSSIARTLLHTKVSWQGPLQNNWRHQTFLGSQHTHTRKRQFSDLF